jgi:two-component system, NtrC family, sensor kinase
MKLGTKLVLLLMITVMVTMLIHGYLSIRQDRENIVREMRVGMMGLSRSIQAALQYIYAEEGGIAAAQKFVDGVGRPGNIHGIVVYDHLGKRIAVSVSLTETGGDGRLDPTPVLEIDPAQVLATGQDIDGYVETPLYPLYYRAAPILNNKNQLVGAFVLGRRGVGYNLTLEIRRDRIIWTTSILIVLVAVLILFLVRTSVSRPIEELIERIRAMAEGSWENRIEIRGENEISALAVEFNRMCEKIDEAYKRLLKEQQDRLSLERNLRQSDRLASVGQLAAGLAHEIGTPLNIIGGRAEFLLSRPRSSDEIRDNLQVVRSQIDRIAGIVRQLLEFSRRREPAFRSVELAPLLEKVTGLLAHKIGEKQARVECNIDKALPTIPADPDQLQQVFLNLFLNSLQALRLGGLIKIRASMVETRNESGALADGREPRLAIEFEDNGAGIPAEHMSQVFDPFFTTKDVGEGTGLGLSVSYGIVKDHGGEIRVDSQVGRWTRFTILLPVQNRAGAPEGRLAVG